MSADTIAANQAYFNDLASSYDSKYEKTIGELMEHIRGRKDFIGASWIEDDDGDGGGEENAPAAKGKTCKLLDYACGTGLISRALAEFTTQCVGVDVSEGMVAAYNLKAENQGLAKGEMHAIKGNLTDPDDPDPAAFSAPEFFDFDVAAVGLGFHHFDSPHLAAQRLAARLRTGGVLVIVDFLEHEAVRDTPASQTVRHHGFSEAQVREVFESAGVGGDFAMDLMGRGIVFRGHGPGGDAQGHSHGHDHGHGHGGNDGHDHGHGRSQMRRDVFIARGTKI